MMQKYKKTMLRQCGFSLIEGLVAFLILSIGMLGIASLQMISLKAGKTAELRTVAVIKAEEIMERIRNNPTALKVPANYSSTLDDLGDDIGCNDYNTLKYCSSADMARDDIFQWKADLIANMPEDTTKASIVVLAATPGTLPAATVTVTINWQERSHKTQAETQTMDAMSYSVSSHICDHTGC